ncbi:MAG: hypothetical protein HZB55_16225 [Deltaproteobacteria bacterium]|nr:hypothetical protein [Deltaproteobacteria bacterium]
MEVSLTGAGSAVVAAMELQQEHAAQQAGTVLLRESLDVQEELAAELLLSLGIGGNADVRA